MSEEFTFPDPGDVPVLDWIDKAAISADPLYQRPLDTARVSKIAREFSWRSFGALVVFSASYAVAEGHLGSDGSPMFGRLQAAFPAPGERNA